ncbi:hypothetical protein HKX48_001444 [Thoreauomyces humboldtii]|nr:hypothetical protein HKX48_001444 [Thoreauomyces humboldtii]
MRFPVAIPILATVYLFLIFISGTNATAAAPDQYDQVVTTQEFRKYIVSFTEGTPAATYNSLMKKVSDVGGSVVNSFQTISAVVVEIPASLVTVLSAIPGVESVEEDAQMNILPFGTGP